MKNNNFLALFGGALAAFCLFSSALNAQSIRYGAQLSGGISGAIEPVEPVPNYQDITSSIFSFGAAITVEKTFHNPKFGVLIEPGITKRGYESAIFSPRSEKRKIDLYYTSAPISFFYQPLNNDRLRIGLGGEVGYLFEDRYRAGALSPVFGDFHEKFDIAGHISIQTTLLSKVALGLKASRSFSPLTTITYSDDNGKLSVHDWYNYHLHLYARYYIN
jgi:hypothetical protein